MSNRKGRSALIGALVAIAAAVLAQGALASINPSLSLDQSAGNKAGATQNLGMDLKFPPTSLLSTDTPDALTINLPPGLLGRTHRWTGVRVSRPSTSATRTARSVQAP